MTERNYLLSKKRCCSMNNMSFYVVSEFVFKVADRRFENPTPLGKVTGLSRWCFH